MSSNPYNGTSIYIYTMTAGIVPGTMTIVILVLLVILSRRARSMRMISKAVLNSTDWCRRTAISITLTEGQRQGMYHAAKNAEHAARRFIICPPRVFDQHKKAYNAEILRWLDEARQLISKNQLDKLAKKPFPLFEWPTQSMSMTQDKSRPSSVNADEQLEKKFDLEKAANKTEEIEKKEKPVKKAPEPKAMPISDKMKIRHQLHLLDITQKDQTKSTYSQKPVPKGANKVKDPIPEKAPTKSTFGSSKEPGGENTEAYEDMTKVKDGKQIVEQPILEAKSDDDHPIKYSYYFEDKDKIGK